MKADDSGPSRAEMRQHPVCQLLEAASYGQSPRGVDLDALNLGPAMRRKVERKATEIVAVRLAGEHQAANDWARDSAEEFIGSLPSDQRDPGYLKPSTVNETDDPADLAKGVQRW